jgi:hypothetical protein
MDSVGSEYIYKSVIPCIPEWHYVGDPNTFSLTYPNANGTKNIVAELERCNVFFSSPLDIDYSMICAFPSIFCVKDESYGERGPMEGKQDEEDEDAAKREIALLKAVLKKGHAGKRFDFGAGWERNFLWYRYRFLSNKSKPASHVRMFSKIEDTYDKEIIKSMLPPELKKLAERIIELAEQVIE